MSPKRCILVISAILFSTMLVGCSDSAQVYTTYAGYANLENPPLVTTYHPGQVPTVIVTVWNNSTGGGKRNITLQIEDVATGNIVATQQREIKAENASFTSPTYRFTFNLSSGTYEPVLSEHGNSWVGATFQVVGASNPESSSSDEVYISSFAETQGGSLPPKRNSFNKSEVPVVIINAYRGSVVNIKVYSIAPVKLISEQSLYVPEDNTTYIHTSLPNLPLGSFKVDVSVKGTVVKTLYFSMYQ